MSTLSIIIVNYKNQDLITACVQSIVENEPDLVFELIIVDNDSSDSSEEELRKIFRKLRIFMCKATH